NAERFEPITIIEDFLENKKCIVAGSTWKEDEEALQKAFAELTDPDLKLIIAPHEIDDPHLNEIKNFFPASIRFSELNKINKHSSAILIIDNIGMLSRLYKYAYITYVGGGFTKDGVHNVLEAAVFGKPVVVGKNYKKYKEAIELIECEGAKSFTDNSELYQILATLLNDEADHKQKCEASKKYVLENRGATAQVLNYIEENRLLTS
ncbi:MAG TPA: 3-deoxy-D-manno-octulosonic acid transferase, partial [Chitinophagaceae bacterium]